MLEKARYRMAGCSPLKNLVPYRYLVCDMLMNGCQASLGSGRIHGCDAFVSDVLKDAEDRMALPLSADERSCVFFLFGNKEMIP